VNLPEDEGTVNAVILCYMTIFYYYHYRPNDYSTILPLNNFNLLSGLFTSDLGGSIILMSTKESK